MAAASNQNLLLAGGEIEDRHLRVLGLRRENQRVVAGRQGAGELYATPVVTTPTFSKGNPEKFGANR